MHSKLKGFYKYSLITCMFVLGIGSGVATSAFLSNASDQRLPASPSKQFVPFEHAKSSAPMRVEIAKNVAIPELGSDEVILTGRIVSLRPLQGPLKYTWRLPESVQVVEGDTTAELANVKQGELVEVRLRVSGFSKEHQSAITLEAGGTIGGSLLQGSDIIVSRHEDTHEAHAANLKKEADAQLKGIGSRE